MSTFSELKRIKYIDSTRAICMLWIVGVWHFSDYVTGLHFSNHCFTIITYGAMATFMYISGFLLGQYDFKDSKKILMFFKKRFLRLYPLFFLSCSSLFVFHILFKSDYISSFKQYLLSLICISPFIGLSPKTIWFICVIMIFYLITPLILKPKKLMLGGGVALLVFVAMLLAKKYLIEIDYRVILLYPYYVFALLQRKHSKQFMNKNNIWLFLGGVSLYIIACFCVCKLNIENYIVDYLGMSGILILVIEIGKIISSVLILNLLTEKIAYASLTVYLFHRQILSVFHRFLGDFNIFFAYLVIFPMLIVISYYIQFLYDYLLKKIENRINYEKVKK